MTSEIPSEIVEAVFRTTKVPGCKGIFNLSPYGSRVGIYFQQRRALILGWALAKEYGLAELKKKNIVVVGGGVSGLTIFKAFRKLGVKKIKVYEKSDGLFAHYDGTSSRLVHPNYNRWPMLDEPMSFTKLPVLNWYAGNAAEVVEQLRTQFLVRHGADDPMEGVERGYDCEKIVQSVSPLKTELFFRGIPQPVSANIVILATGFGGDKNTDLGFKGYWDKSVSQLFDVGKNHNRPSEIFGTGDGALIDALQCCAIDPGEAHNIPLGVIGRVRHDENLVLPGPNGLPADLDPYSELEREIRDHELDSRALIWKLIEKEKKAQIRKKYTDYMQKEEEFYIKFTERAISEWPGVKPFLDSRLKDVPTPANMTKLVGIQSTAFEPTSAPINKIILAFLIITKRLQYERVDRDVSEARMRAAAGRMKIGDTSVISVCRIGAPTNFPGKIQLQIDSNGKGPRPVKFTSDEMLISSVLSSATGGDFVPVGSFPDVWGRVGGRSADESHRSVIKESMGLIEKYALKMFGGPIVLDKNMKRMSVRTPLSETELIDRAREAGGIDKQFFGIPVNQGEEIEAPEPKVAF